MCRAAHTTDCARTNPRTVPVMARPHGTRSRFQAGCHCTACRAANARYQKRRRVSRDLGRTALAMNAASTAELLDDLVAWGTSLRRVARHIGCSPSSLSAIRRGETRTVAPRIADRVARAHQQVREAARTNRSRRPAA